MNQFLDIRIEEIAGNPPIALFTMETNIKTVQTSIDHCEKVSRGDTGAKLLRILEQVSESAEIPAITIEADGRLVYSNARCPFCQSKNVKRNGTQRRVLKGFFNIRLETLLQKYWCKDCKSHFKVDLSHIIEKHKHYTSDVRNLGVGFAGGRALSLGESADLVSDISGVTVPRETIRQWKNEKGRQIQQKLAIDEFQWSGIYSFDEQFITIKGERWYRYLLIDAVKKRPVNDMVLPKRDHEHISQFLQQSLKSKPVATFVVDSPKYTSLLLKKFPTASIQLCIVHAMNRVKRDCHEGVGHHPTSKQELPMELQKLLGKLWNLFLDSKSPDEAERRFLTIYQDRFRYPSKVRHRLELMAKNLVFLTEYLVNSEVPRTNNPAEGYFEQTHPERIKTKFRTAEGFQTQIMCLDGWKGGILDPVPTCHESLKRFYSSFGELIFAVKS